MTTEDEVKPARPSFFRRYRVVILIVLVCLVFQSFTISLPISGRIVDEQGRPIANAEIAALWQVKMYWFIDTGPAGAVKVSHATSDAQGRYRIPGAFIVHTPMLPFSYLYRSNDMPELVVAARGYQVSLATNDVFGIDGPAHSGGFWFVRSSSLRNGEIKMRRLEDLADKPLSARGDSRLSLGANEIERALSSCRTRVACVAESVGSVLRTIQQGERDLKDLLPN